MKEYFIPHNFKDNGKIFGTFEKRSFYKALCWLIPSVILICILPIPLPLTKVVPIKIFCGIVLIVPPTLLIAFGFTDIIQYMLDFNKRMGVYRQDGSQPEADIDDDPDDKKSAVKRNGKCTYSDFVPVKRLSRGVVQLSSGGYVHMLEIEPLNFRLKSITEREGIIIGFQEFLKSLELDFEITVLTQKADTEPYIEMLNGRKKEETDANTREMISAYAALVDEQQEHGAVTRKFILSYSYTQKAVSAKSRTAEIPISAVEKFFIDTDERIRDYLNYCGNHVVSCDDMDFRNAQLLNSAFCRKNDDFEQADNTVWGGAGYLPYILPNELDLTNPGYIRADGKYISTLAVTWIPYYIQSGYLEDIICYGEGVNVNVYYRYSSPSKTLKDLNMAIGYTVVKRNKAGENQSDIDTIGNCLEHAKYIRKQMSENEKLYYVSIIVSVSADDPEQLEQRVQNVEAKIMSKGMECRRADYLQSRAYLCTLPLNCL